MSNVIFSQKAVYRLQQLASQVYRESGVRYRLSSEPDIVQLIKRSGGSRHPDTRQCYDRFVLELNERQIDALRGLGVSLREPGTVAGSVVRRQAG